MIVPVTWHELRPLSAALFRCDLCGAAADSIHLVPRPDAGCEHALFACPGHDPGGYWFPLAEWLDDEQREEWMRHLGEKGRPARLHAGATGRAVSAAERIGQLTYPVVRVNEPTEARQAHYDSRRPADKEGGGNASHPSARPRCVESD